MLTKEREFNPDEVAALAKRIAQKELAVVELRKAADAARHEKESAECALSNLRLEFTRACAKHIDVRELPPDRRPVAVAVE